MAQTESATLLMRKLLALRNIEWAYSLTMQPAHYDQWVQALAGGAQAQQRALLDAALGSLERYRTAFEDYHGSGAASRETEQEMDRIAEQMLGVSSQLQLKSDAYAWLLVMTVLVVVLGAVAAWLIRARIIHSLRGVSSDVATIHHMNLQIASATEEQNRMAGEVSRSMLCVREAAVQGQGRSVRLRQASHELEQLAGQRREALGYFRPERCQKIAQSFLCA